MKPGELQSIREKLTTLHTRCETIMALIDGKMRLSEEDRAHASELFRSLKDDLKRAAAVGTVTGEKRSLTTNEEIYYAPTVRAAALALAPAVNSHPITSNWSSALDDAQIEFSHCISSMPAA